MNHKILFLTLGFLTFPGISVAVTCSQANLTRCLDSVCAINVSSNPAARCQYCGTASAGTPPTESGMRSLSLGQSAKYTLSEEELKEAPTDPGQRYAWATEQCINKIDGCTPDDVSNTYDKLIEQSCKAAGINAQMAVLRSEAAKPVSKTSCDTDIRTCLIDAKRCGPDFSACENDSDFNNFFSACSIEAKGCDDYISSIREELIAVRDTAIENADKLLANIVSTYQSAREKKLNEAKATCTDEVGLNTCIKTVCTNNMPNKCEGDQKESETVAATALCQFYTTACNLLK